jgi:hypothetical protein
MRLSRKSHIDCAEFSPYVFQTRWMLCDSSNLKVANSTFDYNEFYRTVLDLFNDDDFSQRILGEYNK